MFFAKGTRLVEKGNRVGREDGVADVVAVPQADGDSAPKPAEKPARAVDKTCHDEVPGGLTHV